MKPDFERAFLSLAATMLGARLQVMGGEIDYQDSPRSHDGDLRFHLLGMTDYAGEMKLMCQEALG
jgi:hypothetical protein